MYIIAEIEVVYSTSTQEKICVSGSNMAYKMFIDHWNLNTIELQEEFKVILLNRANKVLGIYHMSKGGVSGTVVDVKLLLATALKANASGIIIAHNHPSGNLKPSETDKSLTRKIKKACTYLDILLLDHLIVTRKSYYSFSDNFEL